MPMNRGCSPRDVARTRASPRTLAPYSQLGPSPRKSPTIAYCPVRNSVLPKDTKPLPSRSTRSFHKAHPPPERKTSATTQRMLPATNDTARGRRPPPWLWATASLGSEALSRPTVASSRWPASPTGPSVWLVVVMTTPFLRRGLDENGQSGSWCHPLVRNQFRWQPLRRLADSAPHLAESLPRSRSWDLHLADAGDHRSGSDVGREEPQRLFLAGGFNVPPNCVAAGAARGDRRLVTERALVPLERREHDPALMWLVSVLKEVAGHGSSMRPRTGA